MADGVFFSMSAYMGAGTTQAWSRGNVQGPQESPVSSTSSEGYPSWLPKRPPPPVPSSTLHSLSTHMMFGSDAADPIDTFPGAGAAGTTTARGSRASGECQQMPLPFLGGRKPTPRSVHIISMQDSNAATSGTAGASTPGGTGGSGPRMVVMTDQTTQTTWVSSMAATATPSPPYTPCFPSLPFLPSLFCSHVWSHMTASAAALGGLSPTLFSSSQTPDARLRNTIVALPKFHSPGVTAV